MDLLERNKEMTEEQKTLYYIAENMKMQKSISEDGYKHFQKAIKALEQQDKILQILDDYVLEAWEILEMIKEVMKNDKRRSNKGIENI